MQPKKSFGEKGQVSIEILLIAGVIIMMSMAAFGYYTSIRQSTLALELLKVEALRAIDEKGENVVIAKIDFGYPSNNSNVMHICIDFDPDESLLTGQEANDIAGLIEENFGLNEVNIFQNTGQGNCGQQVPMP